MKNYAIPAILFLVIVSVWPYPIHAAKDPVSLAPSSKWIMEYEDDSCRLLRTFGENDQMLVLTMSRYGPGESFNIIVAGNRLKLGNLNRPIQLRFGDYERYVEKEFFSGSLGDRKAMIGKGGLRIAPPTDEEKKLLEKWKPGEGAFKLSPISKDRYAAAKFLEITRKRRFSFILQTGALDKPFAAMDACIDQLLTGWGIDVEKHKTLSREVKPIGDPGQWIQSRDYPSKMVNRGQPAIVQFRLSVDAEGKTTDCYIQKTTRPKDFDDAVCKRFARKSKFEPALDADGNPIASYWRNTVQFQIR